MICLAALWLRGKHYGTARRTGVECLVCVGPLGVSKHSTVIQYIQQYMFIKGLNVSQL